MSASTRSLGFNWLLKLVTGATCTACSADADAIRVVGGTCTTIGGMDNFKAGNTKATHDVSSFEDTIDKIVIGRMTLKPVNMSGTYDPGDTTQKTLVGDIFHEGVVASSNSVRTFTATDTVNKRRHTVRGYVIDGDLDVAVKNKANFSLVVQPISKIYVCTTA